MATWNQSSGINARDNLDDYKDKEIEVVEVNISLEEEKALNIALNKITGDWDYDKLRQVLYDLQQIDFDTVLTGFDDDELNEIINNNPEPRDESFDTDEALTREPKYTIQQGDIFQLGNHRLMCGDSTNKKDAEKLMSGKKADMVFTDPPYGVDYAGKNTFLNQVDKGNRIQIPYANDDLDDYENWFTSWLNNIPFADYNTCYIWINGRRLRELMNACHKNNIHATTILVWAKNNHVLGRMDYLPKTELCLYGWKGKHKFYGRGTKTTLLEFPKPQKSELHPTMKPVELCRQLIQDGSKQNMIVLDFFGGSGSTLLACEQTNRVCYMMEIDPHYCSVIIERWEDFTGKCHEKLN